MNTRPRIGTGTNFDRIEIYNANYGASGVRIGNFDRPWNVLGPGNTFDAFHTHAEAITYATKEADRNA